MDETSEEHLVDNLLSISKNLLQNHLTPNKKSVIKSLEQGKTLSSLARDISKEQEVSEPTARRTLQMLRDLELIDCGSEGKEGKPIEITETGRLILGEVRG